ncbi:TonB-dependent receptor plug domain-containing protein [Brevundimonas sp.]|uniref:TonB-dependent receptor plug domain-containing protein n=1 Tax=Brevundimonas sp. TaxID=1871086 RepID=UPI002CEBFC28|nr:TonB-dependent receptor [Brevundimonas sp.]HWQ86831.1 TonB-dependent receptor [Brevundimonas sp.]
MRKAVWLAGAAASALSAPALAQTSPSLAAAPQSAAQAPVPTGPADSAPSIDAAQQGVLVFEPAFFADARPDTALDMIARLPGFGLDTGDSDTRGLAGTAGNVLIDGVRPSTKSDSLDQILRRISAAGVARIELIRGGAPGIDMQGRSVIANVVLVRTVVTERVIEANAYFYPDGYVGPVVSARWSRREGDNQIEGSLNAFTDRTDGTGDGFRRRYDPAGNLIQDADLVLWDRIRQVRGTGAVQRRIGGGLLKVNGLLGWFGNENSQDLLIRSGAGSDSFNDEEADEINGELGVNWTRDLGPRAGLELTGLQRYGNESYTGVSTGAGGSSTFTADATAGESIVRATLRYRPDDQFAVETGGEIAFNFLDSTNAYEENSVAIPLPSASVRVEELRGELFGQATWRPGLKFTLEAGVRVEVSEISQSGDSDQSKSFVFPKPRIQMTWTPWAGHQFRFRAEREVGQLDFGDFVASADIDIGQVEGGNPDLEPQKATVLEAIYERRFWGEGVLDFTWQYAEIEDVVDVIPLTGGFDGVGNIGDGTSSFFQTRLTLPTDKLGAPNGRLQVRGSWAPTSVVDPVTGEERRFQGNQAFGCGVAFNQDLKGGRWSYGFDHGCNVDKGAAYRVREIRYFYSEPGVSAYGQWKPRRDLTVRVDLGNASNRRNGYNREIYAGPRDTAPLAFREVRRTRMSPWLFVQIRKTF